MGRHCSVPKCNSSEKRNENVWFHAFPGVSDKYRVWIEGKAGSKVVMSRRDAWQLKLKIDRPTKYMYICSLHFTDDDYFYRDPNLKQRKFLKKNAVPSQNLPVVSTKRKRPECSTSSSKSKRSRQKGLEKEMEEGEEFAPDEEEIDAAYALLELL